MRVSPFCFSFLSIKKFGCVQCLAFAFVMLLPIAHSAFHPVSMVSPLNVSQFTLDLAGHPDRQAVAYVLNGLQHGFRLGIQPARKLKPARKNKPSAFQNPKVIDDYLATEVARGRVAGPFPSPPLPNLQVSSFGVIPKKGQPGKWEGCPIHPTRVDSSLVFAIRLTGSRFAKDLLRPGCIQSGLQMLSIRLDSIEST